MSTEPLPYRDREIPEPPGVGPRIIFFVERDGVALIELLLRPGLLDLLGSYGYGVALALQSFDALSAQAVHMLNRAHVSVIAWLILPDNDGFGFNLANYPRAISCYQQFHEWAHAADLQFAAVGLDIDPPLETEEWSIWRGVRVFLRRLWLARDNALYPAARGAFLDLVATIRHDGYEVHTYQIPLIADDRRAGTTLIQRALDVVDLPSDLEVLMCSSQVPIDLLDDDLGGALIASYGESADAIGLGTGLGGVEGAPLPWPALRRDLLLAAQHTDTIYLATLEEYVENGLLARIVALDWNGRARAAPRRRLLVGLMRSMLLGLLMAGFVGWRALAWAGWGVALFLWVRLRQAKNHE